MSSSYADSPPPRPWRRIDPDGSITLTIHARPGAKRSEVSGAHAGRLMIRLAGRAIEGKANAALIAFLARAFAVPEHAVTPVRGAKKLPQDRAYRDAWGTTGPGVGRMSEY